MESRSLQAEREAYESLSQLLDQAERCRLLFVETGLTFPEPLKRILGSVDSIEPPKVELPADPPLRNHGDDDIPKNFEAFDRTTTKRRGPDKKPRRGRPPMITREAVDQALGITPRRETTSNALPDPKCSRASCVHTKSQHTGSNGKCVGCWCFGFVARDQFDPKLVDPKL